MPFAAGLRHLLYIRDRQLASELNRGDSLEDVLDRHLLTVERMSERELVTSILILSPDGKRLTHAAGPNLPRSYRDAIDGSEIGPSAGSCGTAAFHGRPVYVSDIATDPLWAEYRHLALPHGFRSCWSTPIRTGDNSIVGTFAVYHLTPGNPTEDEIAAIGLIAGHVAQAIRHAREAEQGETGEAHAVREPPRLRLVAENQKSSDSSADPLELLLARVAKLGSIAQQINDQASALALSECRTEMEMAAHRAAKLAAQIRQHVERLKRLAP